MPDPSLHYADLIGQENAVARLRAFTELFASSGTMPGHILLIGDEGMGQSIMAMTVANEFAWAMEKPIQMQAQHVIGKPSKKAAALCRRLSVPIPMGATHAMMVAALDAHFARKNGYAANVSHSVKLADSLWFTERRAESFVTADDFDATTQIRAESQILLLSNLHQLRKLHWNGLRSAMRDGESFMLVATCPKKSDCPAELLTEFSLVLTLQPYSKTQLQALTLNIGRSAGVFVEPEAAELIARASDGRPGHLAAILRGLAKAINKPTIGEDDVARAFAAFGIMVRDHGGQNDAERIRELSGQEFESLITRLLTRMGFHAELTRTTGDGGIDIIAMLDKPIVGGRYLFQCKRFAPENLVGAPTVRDFYGAVTADRAVKGVFITTSNYTAQAREFAERAGVDLIDIAQLENLFLEYGIVSREDSEAGC